MKLAVSIAFCATVGFVENSTVAVGLMFRRKESVFQESNETNKDEYDTKENVDLREDASFKICAQINAELKEDICVTPSGFSELVTPRASGFSNLDTYNVIEKGKVFFRDFSDPKKFKTPNGLISPLIVISDLGEDPRHWDELFQDDGFVQQITQNKTETPKHSQSQGVRQWPLEFTYKKVQFYKISRNDENNLVSKTELVAALLGRFLEGKLTSVGRIVDGESRKELFLAMPHILKGLQDMPMALPTEGLRLAYWKRGEK